MFTLSATTDDTVDDGETVIITLGTAPTDVTNGTPNTATITITDPTPVFDADANYRILTRYGSTTEIDLADYLAAGETGITFSLDTCDSDVADYYDSATVIERQTGAGHPTPWATSTGPVTRNLRTETETVCTVTGTRTDTTTEDQEFELYTVSDRRPTGLAPGTLSVVEARAKRWTSRSLRPDPPATSDSRGERGAQRRHRRSRSVSYRE